MNLVEYLPPAVFVNLGLISVKLNPADGSILAWATSITAILCFAVSMNWYKEIEIV